MPEEMILAVDVGNTRIKFGVFARAASTTGEPVLPTNIASLAIPVAAEIDWGKVTAHFAEWSAQVTFARVAGANPGGVEAVLSRWPAKTWPGPIAVYRAAELPLRVNVEFPDQVGIDRLLEALAANVLRPQTDPVVVVGAGTATTVDYVSREGAFEGGAILPGLELGARALHQYTALLPLIDVQSLPGEGVSPVGRNTQEAVRSGLWFGHVGAVRELIARLAASSDREPFVIVTGGNGRWLATALGGGVQYEPDLAMRGLAYVAQLQPR